MASRSCKRKTIQRVDFKKCARGRKRWCPVATLAKGDRRPTIKTKGGGRLVDGGKRVFGAYGSKGAAQKAMAQWMSKHNGIVC